VKKDFAQPGSINLAFLEGLYAEYLRDPAAVPADWQEYFGGIRNGDRPGANGRAPNFAETSIFNPPGATGRTREAVEEESTSLQDRVDQLIRAYRICGHMIAQIDPLGLPRPVPPELDPAVFGFTDADMERRF
jgi:2-oxoglutarate dehydrogenase E1 component